MHQLHNLALPSIEESYKEEYSIKDKRIRTVERAELDRLHASVYQPNALYAIQNDRDDKS